MVAKRGNMAKVRRIKFMQNAGPWPYKVETYTPTPPEGASAETIAQYKVKVLAQFAKDDNPTSEQGTYPDQTDSPDERPANRELTIRDGKVDVNFTGRNPGNYTLRVSLWNAMGALIAYDIREGRKLEVLPEPKGVEVVLIASFPSPWRGRPAAEIEALNKKIGYWQATSADMRAIAESQAKQDSSPDAVENRPPELGELKLEADNIHTILTLGDFLDTAINKYEDHSIARLVLITHSDQNVLAFSGNIRINSDQTADVTWPRASNVDFDPSVPSSQVFNETVARLDTMQWLGENPDGKYKLQQFINKFSENGEIVLISCKAGTSGFSLSPKHTSALAYLLKDADIPIKATNDQIWYWTKASGNTIADRDLISVGEHGTQGRGYRHILPELNRVSPVKP
jgi:hypothetical protein